MAGELSELHGSTPGSTAASLSSLQPPQSLAGRGKISEPSAGHRESFCSSGNREKVTAEGQTTVSLGCGGRDTGGCPLPTAYCPRVAAVECKTPNGLGLGRLFQAVLAEGYCKATQVPSSGTKFSECPWSGCFGVCCSLSPSQVFIEAMSAKPAAHAWNRQKYLNPQNASQTAVIHSLTCNKWELRLRLQWKSLQ